MCVCVCVITTLLIHKLGETVRQTNMLFKSFSPINWKKHQAHLCLSF